jgi:DNA-binding NarL/FixJ family response regulator
VADVSLPGLDGIELISLIHARYPGLPVLVISGHQDESYARRAREAGAVAFLSKQGLVAKLPAAIRVAVRGTSL